MRHSDVLRETLALEWPAEIECPDARFQRAQRALQKACAAAHAAVWDSDFEPPRGGVMTFFGACHDEARNARNACLAGGGARAVRIAQDARGWLRKTKASLGPSLWSQVLLRVNSKGV